MPRKESQKGAQRPLRSEDPKVRVRIAQYEQLQDIAQHSKKHEGISVASLTEEAIQQWLQKRTSATLPVAADPSDLNVTARDVDHKRILAAVEMLLNDPDICPVHRPVLEALLAPELKEIDEANGNDDDEEGAA